MTRYKSATKVQMKCDMSKTHGGASYKSEESESWSEMYSSSQGVLNFTAPTIKDF